MLSGLTLSLFALTTAIGLAAAPVAPAVAQTTKLKLVLNWKYMGPQGMFFLADDRGYFKAEGLEVSARSGERPVPRCPWLPTAPMTSGSATSTR